MGNPMVLTFTETEVQSLIRIDLDADQEGALLFIRNILIKKLKDISRPRCVPVFEITYSPRQKEPFQPIPRASVEKGSPGGDDN